MVSKTPRTSDDRHAWHDWHNRAEDTDAQHSHTMSVSLECPFKTIAAKEALLDVLRRTEVFSAGCPFPKGEAGDTVLLLKVLDAVPEEELPRLKQLLRDNASALQGRLAIDGGSWDAVLVDEHLSSPSNRRAGADSTLPLAKLLKEGTKKAHAAAERTSFVREFIKGQCSSGCYAMMIKDLYHVYAALETAAERCATHAVYAPLHHPYELGRTHALESDMSVLFGQQWRTDPRCLPSAAATSYAARLAHVAEHSPELMVAHAYTRYLGDLSGGRVLMRIARRMLDLAPGCDDGVRFYIFDHVADPKAFKSSYRQRLNELQVTDDLAARIVDEANAAVRALTRTVWLCGCDFADPCWSASSAAHL